MCARRSWRCGSFIGLCILWTALASLPAAAIDPAKDFSQLTRRIWRTENGLPQTGVTALAQTADGYLLVGTQGGLARFDGVRFTVFDRTEDGFEDVFVTALAVGREGGTVWIGARDGLLRYENGVFRRYDQDDGLPSAYVRSLLVDRRNRLWIGTYGGGLARMDGDEFTVFDQDEGLLDPVVRAIFEDSDGDIWLGTEHGLHRLRDDHFTVFGEADGLPSAFVRSIGQDAAGRLWVGTEGSGLALFEEGRFRTDHELAELAGETIWSLEADRDGGFWVATQGRGLARLVDGVLTLFGPEEGLPHEVVWSLFEDREGSFWAGTRGGLIQLRGGKVASFTARHGLQDEFARTIYEDREDNLWVGTAGGLHRYAGGRFDPVSVPGIADLGEVRSIFEDSAGAFWLGTRDGLIRREEERSRRWVVADGLRSNRVNAIAEWGSGDLWVGTGGGGLSRLRDGRIIETGLSGTLEHGQVRALLPASDGTLWVGTEDGLYGLKGDELAVRTVDESLAHEIVLALHEDDDGTLWIGTAAGLSSLADGEVASYRAEGMWRGSIFSIVEDAHGRLWLSTSRGVLGVHKRELAAVAVGSVGSVEGIWLTEADGMASSECNGGSQPAGIRTRSGHLWFPTIRGVARVDPRELSGDRRPLPVLIERVMVDGETRDATGGLRMESGVRSLQIDYSAPSFAAPDRIRFRYRLAGFDAEWVEAGYRRSAFYTNLSAGRYRFEVMARDRNGAWSRDQTGVDLYLRPAFWQTRWFPALVLVALIAAFTVVHRLRTRWLHRRQEELGAQVEQATAQLRQANYELSVLASMDSLTGIANHRSFTDALEREWRRMMRADEVLSLVMIDIDFFKSFNDRLGHRTGDRCLQKVASALSATVQRAGDLVARYGGEEFVALLPATGEEIVVQIAERLRLAVEELEIRHPASDVADVVTVSVGYATVQPAAGRKSDLLMGLADDALYRAKAAGRNRISG